MVLPVDKVNRALVVWACICSLFLSIMVSSNGSQTDTRFFAFGPREDLVILDIRINTFGKYFVVMMYTIVSTVARTILQEIVSPWIIQSIQNDKPKDEYTKKWAQEVALGEVFYRWFDWFMYMHILMAQIDMMIIELIGNLAAVIYTTRLYMKPKPAEEIELLRNDYGS